MKHRLILAASTVALVPLVATCASDEWAEMGDAPDTAAAPSTTTEGSGSGPGGAADPEGLLTSLSGSGTDLAAATDWATHPRYGLHARLDPGSGLVEASMRASLPVGADATEVDLRWFPGVAADGAELRDVTVDGAAAEPVVDQSLVTIPLAADHGEAIEVTAGFRYTAAPFDPAQGNDPLSGGGLEPTETGLLARSDDGLTLGHWFPIWIPAGLSADPELDGFGDIANFPAATIQAELEVPDGVTVVTSGVRLDESSPSERNSFTDTDDEATEAEIVEGGIGLRDFGVVVLPAAAQAEQAVGDTRVVVTAPEDTKANATVVSEAAASVETLSEAFGGYPWRELDIVAAPLGANVGGMEWPGMVWIEPTIFGGGIPGLGDLGDLGDLGELGELGGLFGDMGLMLETMREWTVAHEVGHQWWHALIGNDSLTAPVIDEPLAQHSACLVERELRPDQADDVCAAQTAAQYTQLRSMMGVSDAVADRPSDQFDSSTQYGAVVYGKAPNLYRELEQRYGVDATTDALAAVVGEHAFDQITPHELVTSLGTALGDAAGTEALWNRWMEERHGDRDLAE